MAATEKRLYLGKDDRRKQLLQAASALVEKQGWSVLSMSALAESTGVSRQLIYQHFPNLEALLSATSWAIFVGTMDGTRDAIMQHPTDLKAAIMAAELVTLDMPVGQGDALWQLVAGMDLGMPELESIRVGIRDVIIGLWVPPVRKLKGLDEENAKSLVWMMIMAFWATRNMIRDQVVSREVGLKQFHNLIEALL
jgi:hypothetical protein